MRKRPIRLDMSESDLEAALGDVVLEKQAGWQSLSARKRRIYFDDVRKFGGEPPELTALLSEEGNRDAWSRVPLLVKLDWHRWINYGRTARQRRRRTEIALRRAPLDVSAPPADAWVTSWPKVWYRSAPKLRRLWPIRAWEDAGVLEIDRGFLTFHGKKGRIELREPRVLDLGRCGVDTFNVWVTVEDCDGQRALFSCGGLLGWRGVLGDTTQLAASIRAAQSS
jgi:hypothetical protein